MNRCSIQCAAFLIACLCPGILAASGDDLLDVVSGDLGNDGGANVAALVDESIPPDPSLPNARTLKEISAFGLAFSGRAMSSGGRFNSVGYWVTDPKLLREVAEGTFKTMAGMLERQFGPGKLAEVPNFEDASPEGTRFLWWPVQGDVVLLSIHGRSRRANLSLERRTKDVWLADMGANESEFWKAALQEAAGAVIQPFPDEKKGSGGQASPQIRPPAVDSAGPVPQKSYQSAGNRRPKSSYGYWLSAGLLIAAVMLFLLLRTRKAGGNDG